jgi:hypothetical protein
MPDLNELRATVVVDTSGLSNLASAAETTTQAILRQSAAFEKDGLTANETKMALASLGYTSEAVTKALGTVTVATTGLDRAMTTAASRILVTEAGLGRMGLSLARVGIAAGVLGPALTAAFPILAIVGVIELIVSLADKFDKFGEAALKAADAEHAANEMLNKQQDEIRNLQERYVGITQGPMAEFNLKMKDAGLASANFSSFSREIIKNLEDETTWFQKAWYAIEDWSYAYNAAITNAKVDLLPPESLKDIEDFIRLTDDQITSVKDLDKALASVEAKKRDVAAIAEQKGSQGMNAVEQQKELAALETEEQGLRNRIAQAKGQAKLDAAESAKKSEEETLKLLTAQVSANKEVATSLNARAEAEAMQRGRGYLSPDQKGAIEATSQLLLYEIEKKGITDRLAEIARYGETYVGETKELNIKLEALAEAHANKMHTIQANQLTKDAELQDKEAKEVAADAAEKENKAVKQREDDAAKALDRDERAAQTRIANANKESAALISLQLKKGQYSGAEGTAEAEYARENAAINTLIQAEERRREAIANTNLTEQQKDQLTQASLSKQLSLVDQLSSAFERMNVQLQNIKNADPWNKMKDEMERATQVVQLQTGAFTTFTTQLNSGVGSALEGWIMGGERIGLAMEKMFAHILASEASFVVQWLLKKAELWALDAITGKAAQTAAAASSITANAAVAASGAAASVSMIPFVGWMLAPEVAAETFASTIAWASMLAMESGGIVPRTGIIMAHEGEGMLPRNLTEMLTSAAGEGKGGGDTHIHNHINAVDGASVQRMIENHKSLFVAAGQSHLRRSR